MITAEHEVYFRHLLGDVTEPTAPFGLLNVRGDGSGIDEARSQLDVHLAQQLRSLARRLGVSAASIFHVAWAQVVARVSGRDDVVFGTVLFGRMHSESERVFGLLINTLPVRLRIADLSVVGAVRCMHEQLAEILLHELAPLSLALRCSAVPAPKPLFSSLLNYRHSKRVVKRKQVWDGIRQLRGDVRTSYPLMFAVDDFGDGFQLKAQVEGSIGAERVCGYMHTALVSLVEALECAPESWVRTLEVLPATEREQLLGTGRGAPEASPVFGSVASLFEERVRLTADAVAVVSGEERLTYGALNVRANQLGHYLRTLGVGPEARVLLYAERGIELVLGVLAVLKAGGAYVPVDAGNPVERLGGMVLESAPVAMLVDARTRDVCLSLGASVPVVDLGDASSWGARSGQDLDRWDEGETAEQLAYVIYTSGSTGSPKGVMVRQGAVAQYVASIQSQLGITAGGHCGWVSTVAADLGYTMVFPSLLCGGVLHVVPVAVSTDAERFGSYNLSHGLEYLKITPSHFSALLGEDGSADAIPLRGLVLGGEVLSGWLVGRVQGVRPGCRVYNHYGPTECTIGAVSSEADMALARTKDRMPLGRPLGSIRVTIQDEAGCLVPVGVAGEIYIGGAGVARGYLGRAAMTAERFVPDPYAAVGGSRMYRTGDRGRWGVDGLVEFLGRTDRQVKVRGYRVELGEIEARLRMHARVREVVVVARGKADGELELIAYYTESHAEGGVGVGVEALREHLQCWLPEHMMPSVWVALEAMPLTVNGKVDVLLLPSPESLGGGPSGGYEEPIGEIETTIARVWSEVLKRERVSRRDNFFELGGHSLLAVRVMARLRQAGIRADIGALFATPTVAELASSIDPERAGVVVPGNGIAAGSVEITPGMLPLVKLTEEEIGRVVEGVAGGVGNVQDIYPLAPLQEGILFHALLGGESDPYVVARLIGFDTRSRVEAYLEALQAVIDRHDILRTGVMWEGLPEPVQVVWRQAKLAVEEVELEPCEGEASAALYARYDPRHVRLDVQQAPLMRVAVAWDAAGERWLLMHVQHHLIGDHVTTDAINAEVEAFLSGEGARLPQPRPFRNLVAQARLGITAQEHETFFRKLLGDVTEPTAPFGLLNVHEAVSPVERAWVRLPVELSARVRAQARGLGVSAACLFHVAWAQVLARVSGRSDVVFGTVLFGRMQGDEGAEHAFGLFMNTLPVRVRIEDAGAADAVRSMHAQLASLLRHEHAPLALAQRCSGVPAPAPLFSSLLNYRYGRQADAPGRRASEGIQELRNAGRTNYPVALSVEDLGESFHMAVEVAAENKAERVMDYMRTGLSSLLEALERAPERAVGKLEVLPLLERRRVLYEWNATEAEYPVGECLAGLFERTVRATPDAVAVVCEGESLTYRGLQAAACEVASRLRDFGVGPDSLVGISVERSVDLMIGVLGILLAGGAYLPLDAGYPLVRLQGMLEESAPVALLTRGRLPESFDLLSSRLPIVDLGSIRWCEAGERVRGEAGWSRVGVRAEHLAYVMYTSGSTGQPKGVMVSQGAVVNRLTWMQREYGLRSGDTVLQKTPITFDVSVWELFWPLLVGARLVMARPEGHKDPGYLCETIVRYGVTTAHFVPSMLELFLSEPEAEVCRPLRRVVCSGEVLPGGFVEQSRAVLPQASVHNLYGPTEAAVDVTAWTCGSDGVVLGSVPIGRPMGNVQIYILDGGGNPTPVDVAGELYIGGVQVGRGYLGRPGLSAERFLPDPFGKSGDRLYRTGDLGCWRWDGTIEFLGRIDFQVKIRGYRIELEEIEACLRGHAAVRDVVVVAREVEGDKGLVAYYTGGEGAEQDGGRMALSLRAHVSSALPDYMVPTAYVWLSSLPLTVNGKMDRGALPSPEARSFAAAAYEAPLGEVETTVASIWSAVLKREQIGRHDNFFALGGHSLLAVRVMARLRQAGLPVDVRALFATPTVAELASSIDPERAGVVVPGNGIAAGSVEITPGMLPLVKLTEEEIGRVVEGVAGGVGNVQDIYPLAPLQEGILFHALLGGESDPYVVARLIGFDTRSRVEAYLEALQAVIDRHDILRTGVMWEGLPEPVQVVWRQAKLAVEEVELEPCEGEASAALYARYDPRHVRLDVQQAPLMRVAVAWDAAGERWLLMHVQHHLIGDHVTTDAINAEVEAFLSGEGARLPQPRPFRNLVAQARLGITAQEHETFFRKLLGDVTEPTAPFGLLNVHGDGTSIDEALLAVEPALSARVRAQARGLGVSAACLFHVAWAQVLARVSGRSDVVFGTVLFGRMQGDEGAEHAFGLFMNTLPVRLSVGEGAARLVRSMQQQLASLLRHEHAPLALAQRCSGVPAPAPLFSSLLNYRHRERPPVHAHHSAAPRVLRREVGTNYPVTLSINDQDDEFNLTVQVQGAVKAERVMDYMRTGLSSLLEALERAPERAVGKLEVLPLLERRRVLYEWNATEAEYPVGECLAGLFERTVRATPDAVAVVCEGESLTYRGLQAAACEVASRLRDFGVGPDSLVGISVERSVDLMIGVLGILLAGGAYLPLDAGYPLVRLQGMLEESAPVALLTRGRLPESFDLLSSRLPIVDLGSIRWCEAGERVRGEAGWSRVGVRAEHLAYVMYTSGSTGQPKGVMVSQGAVVNRLTWMQREYGLRSGDTVLQKTPITFDVSVWELFWPLLVGARLVMARPEGHKDPGYLCETIVRYGVTTAHFVPSMLELFLSEPEAEVCRPLRRVVCSGEVLPGGFVEQSRAVLPQASVHNLYGPTEAAVDVTAWTCGSDGVVLGSVPIGRPMGNVQIYILDGGGNPTPVDVAGELYIGGVQVGRGYLGRPGLSAERFLPDPFGKSGDRLYRTGDLGCWRWDGTIEFLGRIDFQVKIRGYRIELEEIEACLRGHAAVRDVVVVAREVEGDKGLVAYYTGGEGAEQDGGRMALSLRAHVSSALPDYMVPTAYVWLSSLPLTVNGKMDRGALPSPEARSFAAAAYEAPLGEVETTVASIWSAVLKREQIGRHDNFFALGGHSLLAVRVMARLRQAGLPVDVRALFATPTVAELASSIDPERAGVMVPGNGIAAGSVEITPGMLPLVKLTEEEIGRVVEGVAGGVGNVQDIYPLAPLQEGILFHALLGGESDPYVVARLIGFDTRSRVEAYLEALQAVIDRHDILRTGVMWEGLPEPVQVVWRQAKLAVEEVELEPCEGEASAALYARYDPRHVRLDVQQAPLMRVAVAWDAAGERWLLMQRLHHLVGDHVSLEVLDEEIETHLVGNAASLPIPQPFRNLVAQARHGVSAAEHEAYFRQLLGEVTEPTAPFALMNVYGDGATIDEALQTVEPALARRLRAQARELGVSAACLFHVAWAQALAQMAGLTDVVFGTVLFGRMRVGEERTLGLFMNTLPVRLSVGEGAARLVRSMQQQLAALLHHEHAPLSLAQRCSGVPAPTPLFSSLLNFRYRQRVDAPARRSAEGIRGIRVEERTNYPVVLSVDDFVEGFQLKVQVIPTVAARRVCQYMETALLSLVEALESTPERQVRTLEVLSAGERHQLLYEWNATEVENPVGVSVSELFERVVRGRPEAVAVECEEQSLTYDALNRRGNQLARALMERGIGSGDRVAVGMERGLDLLVAMLGVLKSGGVYVPLDVTYPADRLREIVEDSAAEVVLTSGAEVPGVTGAWPILDLQDEQLWRGRASSDLGRTHSSRELSYIIYTSGTTGRPKGVMVEQGGMLNHLWSKVRDLELTAQDRVGQTASQCFDISIWQFLAGLLVGGTTVIVRDAESRDPSGLQRRLSGAGVTVFETVPVMLEALTAAEGEVVEGLGSVRWALVTGEACAGELCRRWLEQHPGIPLVNAYGPTECSDDVTHYVMASRPDSAMLVAPIGRPVGNTRLYVLNGAMAPVPRGVAGELYVGGAGVGRGYWRRSRLTAEHFVPDGYGARPGMRLYGTGDVVRYTDGGVLEFLGRTDTQVKIRGYRTEPEEIESRLRTHGLVRSAVVVAREVGGDMRLVAYYTGSEAEVSEEAETLRVHLASVLPAYMVPAAYVRLAALPLMPSGKIDRNALPLPDASAYATGGYEAPEGENETALAAIWADVLHVDRVGRHDNFFSLGGHSLLAMTLMERMRRRGFAVDVGRLFVTPTIAQLTPTLDARVEIVNVPQNLIPVIPTAHQGLSQIEVRI